MLGVGVLSLLFGVSSAWVISRYNFPGRAIFEWALLLPDSSSLYYCLYTLNLWNTQALYRIFTKFWLENSKITGFLTTLNGRSYTCDVLSPIPLHLFVNTRIIYYFIFQTSAIYGTTFLFSSLTSSKACDSSRFSFSVDGNISDFGTVDYFALEPDARCF